MKRTLLALAVWFAVGALSGPALGALTIDLRFANGQKEMTLSEIQALNPQSPLVQIQVWAQVTGSTSSADGLSYVYGSLFSNQVGGGVLVGGVNVGIIGITLNSAFAKANDSSSGVVGNYTADSIQDWGQADGSSTYASYIRPYGVTAPSYSSTSGVTSNAITGGTEFLIATATFRVGGINPSVLAGSLTDARTEVAWIKPSWTSPTTKYHSSAPDGLTDTAGANYLAGSPVAFVVPEPATAGLLAAGGLLAVIRRRRK